MEKLIQSGITNLVKWLPSGVSVGIMTNALLDGQWKQAILLSCLTACSSLWVKFSSKFMEEAGKETEVRGGGLAKWLFTIGDSAANDLKERLLRSWRHLTSDFEDKYYQRLIYICRNYETQGLDKDKILKLQRVFVPLKISQKSLAKISQSLIQSLPDKLSKRQDISEILVRMTNDSAFRRLAILGAPGSGKTTLLRYLTLVYAYRQQRKHLHPKAPFYIPVLMYLRDVREDIIENPELSLVDLIHKWLQRLQKIDPLKPPQNWFADKLKHNQCLILLDGLDEIADETERRQVSQWVDAQMQEYPETAFILSSRPLGYKSAKLQQDVTVLEVQPFSLNQVECFIHNWYLETEIRSQDNNDDLGVREEAKQQADDLIQRIQNSHSLVTMAVNPLLLTMIATVHRRGSALPGKRVELYEEICQVLLERRQRAKHLSDVLTASQKKSVLRFLAAALMYSKTRSFSLVPKIDKLLQKKLNLISSNALTSADFLKQMREVSGLLVAKEEGVYEFAHLSFQEYLASVEIKESSREQRLLKMIREPKQLSWWAETIRLYCAQSDASRVVSEALNSDNIATLSLAFDCLEEEACMQPSIRDELESRLIQGLESRNPELFTLAAEVRLSRRLNQLHRINDKTSIDTSYITCAEYQLFVDERRQYRKYYQPDHWNKCRFPCNTATQAIKGIRASDAQSFCQWLSQRTGQVYRLPYVQEAQSYPITEPEIGEWSLDPRSEMYKLVGLSAIHWQKWRSVFLTSLNDLLKQDSSCARARILALDFSHERALTRAMDCACARVLDPALTPALDLDLDIARIHTLELARTCIRALNLDHVRDLDHALNLARELDLERTLVPEFAPELARAYSLMRDLAHDFVRNLNRTRALGQENPHRFIRSYLSTHLTVLEPLIEAYEQSLKHQRRKYWNKKTTRKYKQYNRDKEILLQKFNTTVSLYLVFLMRHLRQTKKLPAWESIRIVREKTS